jgi:1-acyl-sn-glycerol-3-phosphate acyltransferase
VNDSNDSIDSIATARSLPDPSRRNVVWSVAQAVLRWCFTLLLGYRARGFERLPVGSGALLVVNHQSNFDPLLVGLPLKRPVSYMARSTLFPIPLIGWLLRNTYVVPIDREAARAGAIRELVARLERGFLVGMFPEGTRTADGRLGEFKPGFIALVRRSRLPIVPVGIAGAFEAYPRGHLPRMGRVRVVFGSPWQPGEYAELCERGREAELVAAVRQRVQDCVDEATLWREDRLGPAG